MTPYYEEPGHTIFCGNAADVLATLLEASVQCVVTSPAYFGLRNYGVDGQLGLEKTPAEYVEKLITVFREVWRVLKDNGVLWVNLADSYQNKQLLGLPWRTAFALQDDGWILRQDCIWAKPSPMPESVRDRCVKAHEYLFLLAKNERYYWDYEAMREEAVFGWGNSSFTSAYDLATKERVGAGPRIKKDGRTKRSVWTIASESYTGAHFAVFPTALVTPCILAGSRPGDVVLDCFSGSGTVSEVAKKHGRQSLSIDLKPAYCELSADRLRNTTPSLFAAVAQQKPEQLALLEDGSQNPPTSAK